MNIYLFFIEIDCTTVYSILKTWENTCFQNSNMTHEIRNKYQETFIFNRNRLHHCVLHTQIMGKHLFLEFPDGIQELPNPLKGAIQKQSRLGWDQLYYGRVTTAWANAIDEMHPDLKLTGTQVMTQIIRTIWESVLEQWKVRNQHLHQNAAQLDHPNYRQAITTLFEQQHQLPPAAQEALYWQLLEVILDQPAPRLQRWAQRGHQHFTQQLKATKTQARIHTQDIRTFFK